jgi:hypothetical protein
MGYLTIFYLSLFSLVLNVILIKSNELEIMWT